ncbi:F0F1 ATP synthase subunit alpha [Candidatus Dependentiae bacterium]|nr:MAG: F0F1 ATP synthase subunit alpha [Candidatus Dependentiae bacterium]
MDIKSTDLVSLLEKALKDLPKEKLEEIGIVVQVGDGMCKVHGLTNAVYGELIDFEGGNRGIIFNLDEDFVDVFLLESEVTIPVAELEVAKRTGGVFKAPVGSGLLGRVVNALGRPIDGLGDIEVAEFRSIEAPIPAIVDRSPVNKSLETGILAIDSLVPIGRGQRELLIGNRYTGKTAIAIDTILHQKGQGVFCIYVAIGQREANIARTACFLEENGALEYTTIVGADASESVLNQYLAPYVGCTMGEYFRDNGQDALIVYDDLSNHAISFREMSLLLRRAPGREAYPGDIFYLHSRLLERAGKLETGGSLTALPIVQTQSDDITAYIPTNLISITDGQIFLDTRLFNQGIRPAVNVELSVSRVGGAAQTVAIKKMTKALRLELAQYHELLSFAQFGTELDEISQRKLARGARIVELLKQPQFVTYSFADQALMFFLLRESFLDDLPVFQVHAFATQFVSYVKSVYQETYTVILETADMSDEIQDVLSDIAREFSKLFVPSAQ